MLPALQFAPPPPPRPEYTPRAPDMIALNVLKIKRKGFELTRPFDRYPGGTTPDFRKCSVS